MSISNSVANVALKGNIQPTKERLTKSNKLEYTDEADEEEPDKRQCGLVTPPDVPIPHTPSVKKARSDAQKATTEKMRVKLEERRKELVVIKQEAKATALLQQAEVKAMIKDKLKAKQLKTKADEKMRQMLLEASEDEEEQANSEPDEVIYRNPPKRATKVVVKQLPSKRRQPYASQDFPTVTFV